MPQADYESLVCGQVLWSLIDTVDDYKHVIHTDTNDHEGEDVMR